MPVGCCDGERVMVIAYSLYGNDNKKGCIEIVMIYTLIIWIKIYDC